MQIHIAKSCRSSKWTGYDVDWHEFLLEKIAKPVRTGETYEVYCSLAKDEKNLYKDVGGFIFGSLMRDSRAKHNVITRNALTLDLDFAPIDAFTVIVKAWKGVDIAIHTTHSHSQDKPRFRVLVPLSREVTPEEYEAVARKFSDRINLEWFDPTTFERNRLMYFPSCSIDGEYIFDWQEGNFLNVEEVLDMYQDWRDTTQWAYHAGVKAKISTDAERQDPTLKQDIVGAFCRAFTITETLHTFLAEQYVSTGVSNRYTYTGGTTAGGGVVYKDLWFYSHHSTDPVQGRLLNAFELVQLHYFGDDKKAFADMCAWALTVPEVKREMISKQRDVLEIFDDLGDTAWLDDLEIDKHGTIRTSDKNVKLIFENDPNLKGVFAYNEMFNNVYLIKKPLWREKLPADGDQIRNTDFPALHVYLGSTYGIRNNSLVDDVLVDTATKSTYHPIRKYLQSLQWDGVERVNTLLTDYFAADYNEYTKECIRTTLIGAVKRVFEPGCKHDYVLILSGAEGAKKSMLTNVLGRQWASDTFTTLSGKEAFEQLQGKWLIEQGELATLNKSEFALVKHFITKQVDSFRPAYGHTVEDFPRQCVFIGTANGIDFLTGEAGERRFLPVTTKNTEFEQFSKWDIAEDMTPDVVDQIWAEVYCRYICGEQNILSLEALRDARQERVHHEVDDPYLGAITGGVLATYPDNYDSMSIVERINRIQLPEEMRSKGDKRLTEVCSLQIWVEFLGRRKEEFDRRWAKELMKSLRKCPYIDTEIVRMV